MHMAGLIFIVILSSSLFFFTCESFDDAAKSLIFPPGIGNKIQFLTGFGIPVSDLPEPYSITYGYVIKTNFAIFNNASVFHDPYIEYQKRSVRPSRWEIYDFFQRIADSLGYNGRECLLRLICETAATFLVKDTLVSEIIHVLLTPSLTKDRTSVSAQNEEFFKAEKMGKMNLVSCSIHYRRCKLSFLDMFSAVVQETKYFPYNM